MKRIGSVCIGWLLTIGACGGDGAVPVTRDPSSVRVTIEAIAFEPSELQVAPGERVVWTNEDESVEHTITSGKPGDRGVPGLSDEKPDRPDGVFDGTVADAGDTFAFTFEESGTFTYFCRVHPVMTGTVTVSD